jgi:signal transduction histidine kinase
MADLSTPSGIDLAALQGFMRKVRATLGRELRSSLGTIVNYASVIEDDSALDRDGLRDLPRRIRVQATRSAEMLQLLLDAMLLAGSIPAYTAIDPGALLESVVAEIQSDSGVREASLPFANTAVPVEIEPEVLAFVWRAFLLLEHGVAARPLAAARAKVERRVDVVRIGLTLDSNPGDGTVPVDIDTFSGAGEIETPPIHAFALRLSRDLVAVRGGELDLFGRVGTDAAVFLTLPTSA